MPPLTIVGAGFDVRPSVAVPPSGGAGGVTYPQPKVLYLAGVGFDIRPGLQGAPSAAFLAGAGGVVYSPTTALFTTGVGFNVQPSTLIATLTLSVPDPVLAPRTVRAVVSILDVTASDYVLDWGDGELTPADLDATHAYAEGGLKAVTFTARNTIFGLDIEVTRTIILTEAGIPDPEDPNATPTILNDYAEVPRETVDDVLNLTLGRHGYEHAFAMHFPIDALTIRRRVAATLEPAPTTEHELVSFVPDRDTVLRTVNVATDGDGQFILRVAGFIEGDVTVNRNKGHGRLVTSPIPVPRGVKVQVLVKNLGVHKATFRAIVFAENGPVGVV